MKLQLATERKVLVGPLRPRELQLVDECLKHMPVQQRHAMLYDSVGHALCTAMDRTDEGPYDGGHWFTISKDAHKQDGRGAIIPFLFYGTWFEVHLPTAHAEEGSYAWMISTSGDEELHAKAGFAFAAAFVAKFWEYHSTAILHPRQKTANS